MKTISVLTNDPKNPQTNITVSGNVEKFASITPSVIRLNGKIGEELKAEVKIVPESKFPFSISKVTAQEGKNIKYELKENKSESGAKEYLITVENLKKDAGFYYDVLTAATDSKVQPEIKINVMTRIIDPNAQQNQNLPLKSVNDSSKPNSFLEVIQKMQQQNGQKGNSADINTNASSDAVSKSDSASKNGGGQASAVVQDPKRSEELKKKFEALIKEAQEKQNAEAQQKNKEQPKTQAE